MPARFVRVHPELMPDAVKVAGTVYAVGPLRPADPGPGWAPSDLLGANNIACAHLGMARRLLELTAGVPPADYARLLEYHEEPRPDGGVTLRPSEAAILAHECCCQNGAAIITALFGELTAANESGRSVEIGPVSEPNAHAAALAAAHQIAAEVLRGEAPSIDAEALDRLEQLILRETERAAERRKEGKPAALPGTAAPPVTGDEQTDKTTRAIALLIRAGKDRRKVTQQQVAAALGFDRSAFRRDRMLRDAWRAYVASLRGDPPPRGARDADGGLDVWADE